METKTNCINCGAPLHYTETDYGRTSRCEHCMTEYHIDELGRVKENLVKIKLLGRVVEFYIQNIRINREFEDPIWRDNSFRLTRVITNINTHIELELEGNVRDK